MNKSRWIRSICLSAFAAAPAVAQSPASTTPAAPEYTTLRWNEDYSYLKDAPRTDTFDSIKYIAMGPDDWYLSLGGQARGRYEFWNNEAFGAVDNNWGYLLQRYMVHADAHFGQHVRAFAQIKSSLVDDGRDFPQSVDPFPRGTDADEIDIEQLFVDFRFIIDNDPIYLRLGRQNLSYGAERLIGVNDWTNVRQTFEGAKVSYDIAEQVTIDGFLVRPVTVEADELNDGNGDVTFFGFYGTWEIPENVLPGKAQAELYALGLLAPSAFGRFGFDTDTYTAGARLSGNPAPFDYDVEFAYQFGTLGPADLEAYALAAEVGYTLEDIAFTPRFVVGLDYATGDNDESDLTINTFNQLFPDSHAYLGFADQIGRANIIDLRAGVELALVRDAQYAKEVNLRADLHYFRRAETTDGLYDATGLISRDPGPSKAKYVGSEIDIMVNWKIDRHLEAYFGYSHFFPGEFINESGDDDHLDFVYAAVTYTF